MSHQQLDYGRRMRERGFRLTPQRQLILDAICESGGHTTLLEIYQRVHAKAPAIHRATVYRALDFFCGLGLVITADVGARHAVYEIASKRRHHHLVCRKCHTVRQVEHATLEGLFATIEREHGFSVDMDHVVLFGLCHKCRTARRRKGGS